MSSITVLNCRQHQHMWDPWANVRSLEYSVQLRMKYYFTTNSSLHPIYTWLTGTVCTEKRDPEVTSAPLTFRNPEINSHLLHLSANMSNASTCLFEVLRAVQIRLPLQTVLYWKYVSKIRDEVRWREVVPHESALSLILICYVKHPKSWWCRDKGRKSL